MVDGKPFIILGGQVNNDSAFPDRMERAWPKLKAMNANTVEYPVYWNEIEREEGQFDFRDFDQILRRARAEGFRVVMLWFGTWKNGAMDWAPNWVKSDVKRFPRVLDSGGKPIRVLSPHSRATLEADKKAYVAMMTHLRQVDEADRTVIMMQVENESGLLGSIRDYSAESNKLFNGPVPASLVTALKKKPGTWTEVFGSRLAEESFTAYYLSSYINEIAKAGKQIYPLAAYVNAWEGGEDTADAFDSFDRAGESYPSGGPVSHMLDLWKAVGARHRHPFRGHFRAARRQLPHDQLALRPSRQPLLEPRGGPDHVGRACVLLRAGGVPGHRLRRLWGGFRRRSGVGGPLCRPGRGLPLSQCRHARHRRLAGSGKAEGRRRRRCDPGKEPDLRPLPPAGSFPCRARRATAIPHRPPPACWWASWGRTSF